MQETNETIRAKVIFNLQSDEPKILYTQYNDTEIPERFNAYWGCVQCFQRGVGHVGETKRYKNVNGLLKIESSVWKNKKLPQTKENRKNPDNWDSTKKEFITPEIVLNKVKYLKDNERLDRYPNDVVMIILNNESKIIYPDQIVEFGTVDDPKIIVIDN